MKLKKKNKGEMTQGQSAASIDMSKPSITHHLNILKNANLIQSEKRGQFVVYTLNTTVIGDVVGWFYEFGYRL